MRALKSIVRGFFAIQAAILVLIPLAAIFGGLRKHLTEFLAHSTSAQAHPAHTLAAAYAVVAGVLALGLLFAMAWWTTRKPVPTNKGWAIAASVINIGQGALLLLASHLTKGLVRFSPGEGLWCIALGATGLFLFVRTEAAVVPVERKSVAGDRTSAITRHAVTVLSCVAQIAAIIFWSRWAVSRDLFRTYGLVWLVLVAVASILATIIHECGHALIAWCFEMSLLSFKAGPFQWAKREGKWKFKLHLAGLLTAGGAVGAVSSNPDQPRWEDILMIAAGPLANLIIGVPALYAVLHDDWPHYQQTWELFAFTASFCIIAAILNLFPFMSKEGGYSDGARILQIVTGSPLEAYHRAMASIAATSTTERRYRDLDVGAIQRAANLFPSEFRGLHLNLCTCHCFEDRNRFPEAAASLATAEGIYNKFAIDLPAPLHTVFVIGHAFLNRDATAARVWWDRMEAKENQRKNVDYWLAKTALLWIESDRKGAEDAWYEADSLAQSLPEFGAYEFDRYRCSLLRQALNEDATVADSSAAPSSIVPPLHFVTHKDEAAVAPILPAWITPALSQKVAVLPAAPLPARDPVARLTTAPTATQQHKNEADVDGDQGGMFARLAALTARPAPAAPPVVDNLPDTVPSIAPEPEAAEANPELAVTPSEPDRLARTVAPAPLANEIESPNAAENDPSTRIMSQSDRSLPDLLGRFVAPQSVSASMRSGAPSAPPLAGAPVITPLAVDNWTVLPTLPAPSEARVSYTPAPVQTPSKGPSVPAAFARRPRVIAPMPEDPFAIPAISMPSEVEVEPEPPAGLQHETQDVPAMDETAVIVPAQPVQEGVVTPPQIAETVAFASAAIESSEPIAVAVEVQPTVPAPAAVEEPRFDPLAFIRAAALENLST
jgi:hypothetical protein